MATDQLLHGEYCRHCGRHLRESFLAEVAGGIEKHGSPLFPVLCICGGITVIGAGTFVSHFDEVRGFPTVKEEMKADGIVVIDQKKRRRGKRQLKAQRPWRAQTS